MIARRTFIGAGLVALALPAMAQASSGGVLILHGKTGMPGFPGLRTLAARIEAAGLRTALPEMPWSRTRYLAGSASKAFDEIGAGLARLRSAGATKLFIAGHSIGATAALGHAVARGGVDGIAMIATGHLPQTYYTSGLGANPQVRASIDRARTMVAAGKGAQTEEFADNNQGQALRMRMGAADYLSWFEPEGTMDPLALIAKAPCPVLIAVGMQDGLYPATRLQYFDRLPPDTRNVLVELPGGHLETPAAAADRTAAFFRSLV